MSSDNDRNYEAFLAYAEAVRADLQKTPDIEFETVAILERVRRDFGHELGHYIMELNKLSGREAARALKRIEIRIRSAAFAIATDQLIASGDTGVAEPPVIAEFLVAMLASPKRRDALLGDFNELFDREARSPTIGLRRARLRYWARAMRSIGPLIVRQLKRLGVFALVVSTIRRWIGG